MTYESPEIEIRTFTNISFECRAALHILALAFATARPPFPVLTRVEAQIMRNGNGTPLATIRLLVDLEKSEVDAQSIHRVMALLDAKMRLRTIEPKLHSFESDLDLADDPLPEKTTVERCMSFIYNLRLAAIRAPSIVRATEVKVEGIWMSEGEQHWREGLAVIFDRQERYRRVHVS